MTWTMEHHDHAADQAAAKAIRERFPELDIPPFECLGGWHGILERLLKDIREAVPEGGEGLLRIGQVKEKFGGLRAYVSYGVTGRAALQDESAEVTAIRTAIERAVFLAACRADRTCEVCGARGLHVVRGHWHMTRCREHADGGLPRGLPQTRMGRWEYEESSDAVVDLSWLTLAQHIEREAGRCHEPVLQVVIGSWKGVPEWVEADGWPGWTDPVPRHKRHYVEPWDRAGPALSYDPRAAGWMHPVTAWTANWVLVARCDFGGYPDVVSYPRNPRAYQQELR